MKTLKILITLTIIGAAGSAIASANDFYDAYQMKLLYTPSQAVLAAEREGRVNIYMGLTDKQVESVMDEQFERIEAMMFAGVILTDDSGQAKTDPDTGDILTEEDGCD